MWGTGKSSILWFAQLGNSHPSSSQSERSRFVLHLNANALPFTPNKSVYLTKEMRISSLQYVMYLLMKGVYFFFAGGEEGAKTCELCDLAARDEETFLLSVRCCFTLCTPPSSEVHHITHTDSTLAHTPFIIYPNFCFSGFFYPFCKRRSLSLCLWMRAVRWLCGRTVYVMWQGESWCSCQGRSGIDSCVCVRGTGLVACWFFLPSALM